MKKILLLLFLFSCWQVSAQSNWTSSSEITVNSYGNIDTVPGISSYRLHPYDPNFVQQPMKTNFELYNDTLYLLDSLISHEQPTKFYTKLIGIDSLQIVLDTLPSISDVNSYRDEDFPWYNSPNIFLFQKKELRLKLHHVNSTSKYIRYKSIWYRIDNIPNNPFITFPNWQSGTLLSDTTIPTSTDDFRIRLEDSSIVFYHAAWIQPIGYNLNLSPVVNDTMYCELYPSKVMVVQVPLKPSIKKTRSQNWLSPRFKVVDCSDFTDTIHIGYYHERASFDRRQFFSWIQVIKEPNNTISYSHNVQNNALVFLPIQEFRLSVSKEININKLDWITIGEEDILKFEVQRSSTGIDFETFHEEVAVGSDKETNYVHLDENPWTTAYYRIKAINLDDQFVYSNTVVVKRKIDIPLSVYPNPSTGLTLVQGLANMDHRLKISTVNGRTLMDKLLKEKKETHQLDISSYPKGTYLLYIKNLETGATKTQKLLKE